MDLNHILFFVAVISPLLVLARAWRPSDGIFRGWRIASLIVLAVTGVSWFFLRDWAGFIGGGVWFVLLFVPAVGLRKVTELATNRRYKSARKLATVLQLVHPSEELREQVRLFRSLESGQSVGFAPPLSIQPEVARQDRHGRLWKAHVVVILLLLNAAVFLLSGDQTDPEVLHRLGALEPYRVIVLGEYWRLFTALFLHAGVAHLFFNVFALYVLGPGLERTIGSLRFAAVYLISGTGSSVGVVALTALGIIRAAQVAGASGCVMGIVGAWAGFLLRHRHAPQAKERLLNILMIIVIQTAFDLTTPQVSTSAHVCGLISGFLVGLVIAPRKMSI